jgi:putative transcriptional regulator
MAVRFRLREQLEDTTPPMTQAELARLSRVSANTINAMANNKTAQVSLETLDKLCRALRCKPGDLLEYQPSQPKRRPAA